MFATFSAKKSLSVRVATEISYSVLDLKAWVLEFGYATSGPDGPKVFKEIRGEKNLAGKNVYNLERKKSLSVRLATEISYLVLDLKAWVLEFGYATSGPDGPKVFKEIRERKFCEKNLKRRSCDKIF